MSESFEGVHRTVCNIISYGVGHVLNDLCASMWFTYLLAYLQGVVEFDSYLAGCLLLFGQIVDAISTPFVGIESDATSGFFNYGKRKSWHLLGCICVALSYPFIFCNVFQSYNPSSTAKFIFYAPLVAIFQFGWASCQISHLSMIPLLTNKDSFRDELNACRYIFTVLSNITVYCLIWILLGNDKESALTPSDQKVFTYLVLIIVGIGICCVIFYHVGCKEPSVNRRMSKLVSESQIQTSTDVKNLKVTPLMWLKQRKFYQISVIYMCTRLIINISQTYLTMYLPNSVDLQKKYIAIIPLVVFVSSLVNSFLVKYIDKAIGRKLTFLTGLLLIAGSSTWFMFICKEIGCNKQVFGAAVLLGAGGSTLLIESLSLTADLIGCHTESGAFVYGSMSFTDKLSNGVAVMIIQLYNPCGKLHKCDAGAAYFRDIMVFVPAGSAALALLFLLSLCGDDVGNLTVKKRKKATEEDALLGNETIS
ncbi:DgyrCDS8528 [Dimorphilus gyrociliatus]|uniref:DgyrCDS8528 n=1 Tax=Dimorphilus gyrociliatus TaxID=2664684 RepID=A0A7I8VVF6_9ANNE|nr:DgyrCDS8528 [Dimorphilus gyrociliatus]